MHIHTFDSYLPRESPVHRLDPRAKTVITLAFILSTVLLPDGAWLAYSLSGLLLLLAALAARIRIRYLLGRALLALPFTLVAVSLLFTTPGTNLATLHLGNWALRVSDAGLLRFSSILLRSWLAVLAAVLLMATTMFPDLVHALRHLRVPALLTSIIAFMYRYLFVLADESLRLLRAREARSARMDGSKSGGPLGWRASVAGGMVGQLFLRSYDRSERVHQAMMARGYRGRLLTMNPHHMLPGDWAAMGLVMPLIALIQLLARS